MLNIVKIVAASIADKTKAVLMNLVGPGGAIDLTNPDAEDTGETATGQPQFGGIGVVAMPPPPSKVDGRDAYTEGVAIRTGDGLIPIAYRDLRFNAFFPAPKPGSLTSVGWAGAFDSNEATLGVEGSPVSSLRTIYVPYAFSGTTPSKAHVVTLDGTSGNESIALIHGDGMAVLIHDGGIVIRNAAGDAYVEVNASGVVINGNTVITGGATIGSPAGAVPAVLAPPLASYLTSLEGLLNTIAAATVPATTAAVTTFQAATAPLKAAMAATKTAIS